MADKKLKVVYCMGSGRSGSTLFGILLSKNTEAFSGGELTGLTDLITGRDTCACEKDLQTCEFWSEVWTELRKTWSEEEIYDRARHAGSLERTRSLKAWRRVKSTSRDDVAERNRYYEFMKVFYGALQKVSGKDTIIDISKNPLRAYLLTQSNFIDLRIIHLTRDPRGVAWSLNKTKNQAKHYPVWRTALFWMIINRQSDMVRKNNKHSVWLRYEDLLKEPDTFLEKVREVAGIDITKITMALKTEIPNEELHMVAGNKLRKESRIRLKLDTQWIENMPASKKLIVKLLAYPWLRKYGYK